MPNLPNTLTAKILVVDDLPSNVLLLEKILRSAGYQNVSGATDSRTVADLYRTHKYDLILLDIDMPYYDGFQVMAQLNEIEQDSYLPILVLTAQSDQDTRIRALQNGAKDFLGKPFDRTEVLTRIKNILEVRLMHNQLRNQNALLEEKVMERTWELNETRLEIIRRLGRAAEFRDNETGNHIIRLSKYAQLLAMGAGMSDTEAELVLTASPMHDVGKIGIPDSILLRPGPLDAREWQVMQTHVTLGTELLDGHHSELLQTARTIALTHHEKWDGGGYPYRLKGEEIPLCGRIVAICDVFDALLSERPYKRPWTVEAAVAEITRCRGTHFEPRLVDVFLEVLPDLLVIKAQFEDSEQDRINLRGKIESLFKGTPEG
ncbi:MAG: HD domain-containing phosphohydrolase [Pseudomonadota bacterium]